MTENELPDQAPPAQRQIQLRYAVLGVLLAVLVAATAAIALTSFGRHPGDDSAEAGFARDMQVHHAQAVEMATIIRDQTDDPTIRAIAYDILTGQQQQMGQMFAWLRTWGLPQASSRQPMAWMKVNGDGEMGGMEHEGSMTLQHDGRMPGMASKADLDELGSLKGVEAEKQFLKLMIVHHRAGVTMAEAAYEQARNEQVRELAKTIAAAQKVEIDALTDLLKERGAKAP